jgi:hypothetical protein
MSSPADIRTRWHEDHIRIVIEIPGTAHVTNVNQRADNTYVTVLPSEQGSAPATSTDVKRLAEMADQLRSMRYRLCEPKANTNPRYHAFSQAVSSIDKVIASIGAEEAGDQ